MEKITTADDHTKALKNEFEALKQKYNQLRDDYEKVSMALLKLDRKLKAVQSIIEL